MCLCKKADSLVRLSESQAFTEAQVLEDLLSLLKRALVKLMKRHLSRYEDRVGTLWDGCECEDM